MRITCLVCAALVAVGTAQGAVTLTATSGGNSSVNTTAGSTIPVEVTVSSSDALSGVQYDLVAGTTGIFSVTSGAIQAGWDTDVATGMALAAATGAVNTTKGPYGTGAISVPFTGTSVVQILQVQVLPGTPNGTYTLNVAGIGCPQFAAAGPIPADITASAGAALSVTVGLPPSCTRTIVGRSVFYNNSFYDTPSTGAQGCNTLFNGGQPCNDNSAAPTNIVALLPGQAPVVPVPAAHGVVANYINYTKGINGIIVDVQYSGGCSALPAGAMSPAQVAATFEFKETVAGNSGRAVNSAYTGATRVPTSVTVAPHPTLANTDRLTVIFADNTSTNGHWMRTRILSGGSVGDVTPISGGDLDRFYFGLAIAEGYSPSSSAGVFYATATTTDQTDPKPPNNHTTFNRAPLNESYDYNRNSVVDSTDQTLPKAPNNTTTFTALSLGGVAP